MSYAKALREQLGRLSADMHAIIQLATNENNRGLSSDERTRYHALEADYTAIEDSIKLAEKDSSIVVQLAEAPGPVKINETQMQELRDMFQMSPAEKRRRENEKDPHAKAFSTYLRLGESRMPPDVRQALVQYSSGLTADIRNAMSTTTGSQGGYTIPQGFSGQLEEAKKWFGGIDGTVEKFTTGSGNPFPWPTVNDTTNKGRIIGQNVQLTETDLTFGQVTFNAWIGSSDIVLVPLALIEDSYFDMDALVARLLGIRMGRLYNWKCTVGTGTNEPYGIVNAAVTAGNILQLGTGNTASISYNNLVDVEHLVDPAYRFNPATRWMFSDTELKLIKKLVDSSNRPLWQPGLAASFREGAAVDLAAAKPTILDHPYIINQDMASPAASAYSALFGDMSTFKVREVAGGTTLLVLRERYADYLQVGFTAFQRFDSQLVDAGMHPIAVLQQSAT
jgi:HK97 family phage major capsid protein